LLTNEPGDPLSRGRRKIDRIDRQILRLLEKRFAAAAEIGAEKKRRRLPIFAPEREKEILKKRAAESALPEDFTQELFQLLFAEAKRRQ
jgi:chorismate mutase/prephenate dehydrogenase